MAYLLPGVRYLIGERPDIIWLPGPDRIFQVGGIPDMGSAENAYLVGEMAVLKINQQTFFLVAKLSRIIPFFKGRIGNIIIGSPGIACLTEAALQAVTKWLLLKLAFKQ